MEKILLDNMKNRKKLTISLLELQGMLPGESSYDSFAQIILGFEEKRILIPISSSGTNGKKKKLYNTYKINSLYFKSEKANQIQTLSFSLHPSIMLDRYYKQSSEILEAEKSVLEKISQYIYQNGFPTITASSPERSYALVGDEKWIDYYGGRKFLEKIGIWNQLMIGFNKDPLMLAVNASHYNELTAKHLIVENKATFYDCLNEISNSPLTSLVFGSGWKIVSNVKLLPKQLGLQNVIHEIYYFGDLDFEGISIWYSLKEKNDIKLAVPYYKALLNKPSTPGKDNQFKNNLAVSEFVKYFTDEEKTKIINLLNLGHYYPQESLSKRELSEIWSDKIWI